MLFVYKLENIDRHSIFVLLCEWLWGKVRAMNGEITALLRGIGKGDSVAEARLIDLVYAELRRVALSKISRMPPSATLQATALVHEAYLKLFGGSMPPVLEHRGHFYWAIARAMHDILVDRARAHTSQKRGGGWRRLELSPDLAGAEQVSCEFLGFSAALNELRASYPRAADVVQLRVFAALTHAQVAEILGHSVAMVRRDSAFAKAWLHRKLSEETSVDLRTDEKET